jgi:hypothetical protein
VWPLSSNAVALAAVTGAVTGTLALLIALWTRWSLARDRRRRGENQQPWAELKMTPSPELGWFIGRVEIHNPSGQSLAIEELKVEKPDFLRLAPLPAGEAGPQGPRTIAIPQAKPTRSLAVSWIVNEPHLAHSDLAYAGEFLVQCTPSMIRRWTASRIVSCRMVLRGRYRSAKARRLVIPAPGTVKI